MLLLEKLEEITGDVDHLESGSLKSSRADAAGDLSSMPIHMADIGSDNYEQEFSLGLMSSERKIVREIIAALKRIDEGTYGICEGTGEPIPLPRLNGIPWARYCVQFAEKLEKGLVSPPSHAEFGLLRSPSAPDDDHDEEPPAVSDDNES
jgi:RNA polymerase-binding transcription factor DksA